MGQAQSEGGRGMQTLPPVKELRVLGEISLATRILTRCSVGTVGIQGVYGMRRGRKGCFLHKIERTNVGESNKHLAGVDMQQALCRMFLHLVLEAISGSLEGWVELNEKENESNTQGRLEQWQARRQKTKGV